MGVIDPKKAVVWPHVPEAAHRCSRCYERIGRVVIVVNPYTTFFCSPECWRKFYAPYDLESTRDRIARVNGLKAIDGAHEVLHVWREDERLAKYGYEPMFATEYFLRRGP